MAADGRALFSEADAFVHHNEIAAGGGEGLSASLWRCQDGGLSAEGGRCGRTVQRSSRDVSRVHRSAASFSTWKTFPSQL